MPATQMPMDHSSMGHGDIPFDALFIESMIEHHRGRLQWPNRLCRRASGRRSSN
jgi:uncharacterized protein (DUF305 family)